MTAVLAGLVFGLVGSGHCAAMCGPLVLLANPSSAGLGTGSRVTRGVLAAHTALYHGGRALTYVTLGAVVGAAGGWLAQAGLGRGLAIMAGVLLVLQALVATRLFAARLESHRLAMVVTRALGRAGAWMRTHRVQGPVVFGALNGLLPCGFLYAALTAAAGFGSLPQALAFMMAFAAGTTPVLAVLGMAGSGLSGQVPQVIRRAAPVALAVVGVLLIMRGVSGPHAGHASQRATPTAVSHAAHQH